MWADNETEKDFLNFSGVADTVAEIITQAAGRPTLFGETYDGNLKLRDLHRQMDEAVLAVYGWPEASEKWGPVIDLRHYFYEVDCLTENDRTRYTIYPDVRKKILKRLLFLNHERYEEELKQGLHNKKTRKKTATRKKKAASTGQQSLL